MILSKYCLAYQIFIQLTFKKMNFNFAADKKNFFLDCRVDERLLSACAAQQEKRTNEIK